MRQILNLRRTFTLSAILLTVVLSGCPATPKPVVYQHEDFGATSRYSHYYANGGPETCEAARRALLSQGYIIINSKPEAIEGRKSFQPNSDTHVEIEFHVVCASDGKSDKTTTAFANALQDRFALKKTNSSASVGVGAVGALSLPFGTSDDSLVKVASETITDEDFYDKFFILVDHYLTAGVTIQPRDTDEKPAPPVAVPVRPQ